MVFRAFFGGDGVEFGPITTLRNIFLSPVYRPSAHFPPFVALRFNTLVCYCWIEKEAFAPRASRWKIAGAGNHRQFRCYCPLVAVTTVTVKQESIPWQSFVFDAVSVIHDSKHLARPLYHRHSCLYSSGAGRWRFFNRSTAREAVVSLYRLMATYFITPSVSAGTLANASVISASWNTLPYL